MADLKSLQDRYAAIASKHEAQQGANQSALDPATLAAIDEQAEDHAATYLSGLLQSGTDTNKAMNRALAEAHRTKEHLRAVHLKFVKDGAQFRTLLDPRTGKDEQFVVEGPDRNGDLIAYSKSGHIIKLPHAK